MIDTWNILQNLTRSSTVCFNYKFVYGWNWKVTKFQLNFGVILHILNFLKKDCYMNVVIMHSVWNDHWFLWYFTQYFTNSTKGMKTALFYVLVLLLHIWMLKCLHRSGGRVLKVAAGWDVLRLCSVSRNAVGEWNSHMTFFPATYQFWYLTSHYILETRILCTFIVITWKHVLPAYYIQTTSSYKAFHAGVVIGNDPLFLRRKNNLFIYLALIIHFWGICNIYIIVCVFLSQTFLTLLLLSMFYALYSGCFFRISVVFIAAAVIIIIIIIVVVVVNAVIVFVFS